MDDVVFLRVFDLVIGTIGFAVALGLLTVPKAVAQLEKKLDKVFSTDRLEKILNEKKNLSEILLRKPYFFGSILMVMALLLLITSIIVL